jgi:hypothetical protein
VPDELSAEPFAVGANGYTIRVGDRVRVFDEGLRLLEWTVTEIGHVPDSTTEYGHTAVKIVTDDREIPVADRERWRRAGYVSRSGTPGGLIA